MDPEAAYAAWLYCSSDPERRQETWDALSERLARGGFEPKWTPYQKRRFLANRGRTADAQDGIARDQFGQVVKS